MDCKQCKKVMKDYFHDSLTFEEKNSVDLHLYQCKKCYQAYERSKHLSPLLLIKKLSPKGWLILFIVCILLTTASFTIGMFERASFWWGSLTVSNQETIEDIEKFGVGNKLNISSESNDIKMTITHVLADDVQTLIYYKVEDLKQDRQLKLDYALPPTVSKIEEDNTEILNVQLPYVDMTSDRITSANTYYGRIFVGPSISEKVELKMDVNGLVEVSEESLDITMGKNKEVIDGEWTFTFTVKKEEIIERELNMEKEVAGSLFRINEILFAPTATFIDYEYQLESIDNNTVNWKNYEFNKMISNGRVYANEYMSLLPNPSHGRPKKGWGRNILAFETMYYNQPSSIQLPITRLVEYFQVDKELILQLDNKSPETFSFMGTELTVEKEKNNTSTILIVKTPWNKHRLYDRLHLQPMIDRAKVTVGSTLSGIYIDKDGNEIEQTQPPHHLFYPFSTSDIRFITTETQLEIRGNDEVFGNPVGIRIDSYQITSFPDEKITIDLQ